LCFYCHRRHPAAQQLEQPHLKTLFRGLLLVSLDVHEKVQASCPSSVLRPLAAKLTANSLLDLIIDAVGCRCADETVLWKLAAAQCLQNSEAELQHHVGIAADRMPLGPTGWF
jgi:hypothetical protein